MASDRRAQILDEAMALADEEGLDGLTMRGLARRLGLTPMALYPHVGTREELLDSLLGRLLAEVPLPASGDWRERLSGLARSLRAVARAHPGYFSLIFTRPAVSPRTIAVVEYIFQALLEAGVPDAEVLRAERLMSTFVLGYALSEVSGRFSAGRLAPAARRGQLADEEIPAHRRLAAELDSPVSWTDEFEADLADMLAMLAHLGR
ncbi:MAG TPA: TetR/AcrR family transcriptional regulator [Candidatus Dormibacteraeota bacterium]|jgi:AcrR family transcriptional regulator|nr:TetR/AcrR family transcriptional regulator [Candidatus Dormibacteraeota bacterium]